METTEQGIYGIPNLSTAHQEGIQMYERIFLEITDGIFLVILCTF